MGRASGSQRATHTSLGGAGYQEAGTGLCSETLRRKEGDRKVESEGGIGRPGPFPVSGWVVCSGRG